MTTPKTRPLNTTSSRFESSWKKLDSLFMRETGRKLAVLVMALLTTTALATVTARWTGATVVVRQLVGTSSQNRMWCGPAVGATLARMLGTRTGQSDYTLVTTLAAQYTTSAGTTPEKMVNMIGAVGGQVDGDILTGGCTEGDLVRIFNRDQKIVAQIGVRYEGTNDYFAHWVLISQRNADGTYLVKDPLVGLRTMRFEDLREAVFRAPGLGGLLIPVAPWDGGPERPTNLYTREMFIQACQAGSVQGSDPYALPAGSTAQQMADNVAYLLDSRSLVEEREGLRQLGALAASSRPMAQQAFDILMRLFGIQNGGGQKGMADGNGSTRDSSSP